VAPHGLTETGEVRPWRYGKLRSEAVLMDKVVAGAEGR
jgi:hypothetical protein